MSNKIKRLREAYENDDAQSTRSAKPDYGGCLGFFLGMQILGSCGVLVFLMVPLSQPVTPVTQSSTSQGILLFLFVAIVIYLIAVVNIFRRKKWAYYLVLCFMAGSTLLNLMSGNIISLIGGAGFLIFFYNAMQTHVPYLE